MCCYLVETEAALKNPKRDTAHVPVLVEQRINEPRNLVDGEYFVKVALIADAPVCRETRWVLFFRVELRVGPSPVPVKYLAQAAWRREIVVLRVGAEHVEDVVLVECYRR